VNVHSVGQDPVKEIDKHLETVLSEIPGSTKLLNFTPETLKAAINSQPFPVVHLATHGIFSSNPKDTYLIAAEDNRIDLNQIREVLRRRVENRPEAIELLVLAACKTAEGDTRATLGIAGVAVQSGARSTLASLVDANSDAMFDLMKTFYQELGKQDSGKVVTKAEALRLAQNKLQQQQDIPLYWAPFVLVGNWQ
jgi:CHAT domain-containing protein